MMEANPVYSSPMRPASSRPRNSQSTSGLGISHCEMEGPSSHLRLLPPETYPSPVTDWSNQLMPPDSLLETTLDVGNFSPRTCYEQFGGHSDVSVSPLSYYSPQTLNPSSSHGSALDFGGNPGTLNAPSSRFWPNTPHSDATSCEIQIPVKEETDESWEQPLLMGASEYIGISTVPQIPQVVCDNTYPNNQHLSDNNSGSLVELKPYVGRDGNNTRRAAAQNMPVEVVFKWTKNDSELPDERCKIPSADGLQCTICGSRFTRRSNCREHMKRHDPSQRKSYNCEFCDRPFGRRTDLRRHVDSIHHGIRKFCCEQCGQRFSRHDTLSRHKADGCHRRPRNSDASKDVEVAQASQYFPCLPLQDPPYGSPRPRPLPRH